MKEYNIDGFIFHANNKIEEEEYIEPTKIDNIENIFPFSPLQKNKKKRIKKSELKILNELFKNFSSEKIIENFKEVLFEVANQIALKNNNNIFKNWAEELSELIEFTEQKEELYFIDGQINEIDSEINKWKMIGDNIIKEEFIPFKFSIENNRKSKKYNSSILDQKEKNFKGFLETLIKRKNQATENFHSKIKQVLNTVERRPKVDPYLILKVMCKIGEKL